MIGPASTTVGASFATGFARPFGSAARSLLVYSCCGSPKTSLDRTLFDDFALQHYADAVRHLADDAEIVRDEEHRHVEAALELRQQLQDLRLYGDVEGRGRLVGDEKIGLVGESTWRSSRADAARPES